jgi:hypothetical protein
MNEPLLQRGLVKVVGNRSQSDQTVLEQVNFERVVASDEHVKSQVVFTAVKQVRLRYVSTNDETALLIDILFFADDFYATATAACRRFHDVHVFKVADLSF